MTVGRRTRSATLGLAGYWSRSFSALRNRNYRTYALGQTVSVAGTWMQKVAQALLVLDLTDSALLLGLAVALQELPVLLLTVWGGVLSDRFPRRLILVMTQLLAMLPALTLGILCAADEATIGIVLALAFALGCVEALDKPSRLTFVNDLVEPSDVTNAVMFNTIIQNSGKVIGPAIAGVVIASSGLAAAFFLNAVSFVAVVVALLLVRPVPRSDTLTAAIPAPGSLIGTLRYVRQRPALLGTLTLMVVSGLLAYNWTVLLPLMARNVFEGGPTEVGLAFTAMGLGGVIGGLALAGVMRPSQRVLRGCALAFSMACAAVAMSPSLLVGLAMLFVLGSASVAYRTIANAILQLRSDGGVRGRVIALYIMATSGTTPLGGPLTGWICDALGVRAAFAIAAAATTVTAVWTSRYARAKAGAG